MGRSVTVSPFWVRTIAAAIEIVPLITLYLLLVFSTGSLNIETLPVSQWNAIDMIVDLINFRPEVFVSPLGLFLGTLILFYLPQELLMGHSIGKRLLHLRIVNAHGQQPAPIMLLVRNIVRLFSIVLLGLGYWWAAFDTERRTLHDWVAGTWVIDERKSLIPK